jgi:hypothetical protein
MILSYSLDVRQLPLDILFSILKFSYSIYLIYDFFSLSYIRVENLAQTHSDFRKDGAFFTFILYPYWVVVSRDKLLSQETKFINENIKFKKKNVKRNMPNI